MNNWIEWKGGECPVSGRALVQYRRRDGDESPVRMAQVVDWTHTGDIGDILAYRVMSDPALRLAVGER